MVSLPAPSAPGSQAAIEGENVRDQGIRGDISLHVYEENEASDFAEYIITYMREQGLIPDTEKANA